MAVRTLGGCDRVDDLTAEAPIARVAAAYADYPHQAALQRAADTRDADGDGIYCVIYTREELIDALTGASELAHGVLVSACSRLTR
jgi:hypothetical protein